MNNKDIAALRWAVGRAEEWRGALVGNPDPLPLEHFDQQVNKAKAALTKMRKEVKEAKKQT